MSFAALMALSVTQTREQQSVVQNQLVERKRREEQHRKKQEELEKKTQELDKQRRIQHFENLKREEERQRQKLEKEKAIEAERQRREQANLDALRYGPKKAAQHAKYPVSTSQARDEVRKRRVGADDADDDLVRGAQALTREELRERKLQAEQRRMLNIPKKSSHHGSYRRPGKRLPGGAIDSLAALPSAASGSSQTTRERIAAIPPTLVKLNTVKRDLRTIDEIQTQLKNSKALEGDEARGFNDFFNDRKKDVPKQRPGSVASSRPATPPLPQSSTPTKKPVVTKSSSVPLSKTIVKSAATTSADSKSRKSSPHSRSSSSDRVTPKAVSKPLMLPSRASVPATKKRPRSSMSQSPPPKRRAVSVSAEDDYEDDDDGDVGGYRPGSIYSMLRGGRHDNFDNIFSDDDDDMEVDTRILEKEENLSSRIAKREEAEALAAEKRHEEEKLRRKKEKQHIHAQKHKM